uniref:Ig-like domain-containing protein n=1 Tax=Varanus komodoensis TaxID=61221 RepID=A0A8D2L398_VARKO
MVLYVNQPRRLPVLKNKNPGVQNGLAKSKLFWRKEGQKTHGKRRKGDELRLAFPLLTVLLLSIQLTESGPGVVNPGGTFKLTCVVSGVEVGGWFWGWNRQLPGKALQWMGSIENSVNGGKPFYNAVFSNRISITRDTSRNEFYLELRSVTAADTATYFCTRVRQRTVMQGSGASRHKPQEGSATCTASHV